MTAPTNHHLTVNDRHGNTVRGNVVYIQPVAERWRKDVAEVHIVASDWLDPYRYPATYHWPDEGRPVCSFNRLNGCYFAG
jgi:hypothetical protein